MLKFLFRNWVKTLPLRFGLGVLLCANYSCSSSREMAGQDPFHQSTAAVAQSLADSSSTGATNSLPAQTASLDQASQTAQLSEQYAALKQTAQPQADDTAVVRVAKEWPAIPEKRIGFVPPQHNPQYEQMAEMADLPPGGYEQPLKESAPWANPAETSKTDSIVAAVDPASSPVVGPIVEPTANSTADLESTTQTVQTAQAPPWAQTPTQSVNSETSQTQQPETQTSAIQLVSASEFTEQTAPAMPAQSHASESDTEFTPADPRLLIQPAGHQGHPQTAPHYPAHMMPGAANCPPFPNPPHGIGFQACPTPNCQACRACDPAFYPDEYLCDGGDRGLPVHYSPGTREGLDTQDTIAEYEDENGNRELKVSNEVCVYAPKFAAVKTVAGSSVNLGVDRALGAYDAVNGLGVNTHMTPVTEEQTTQLTAARMRSRVSGVETEAITLGIDQAIKVTDHTKLVNTNTDYGFTGQINLNKAESPVNLVGIQAAAVWTRKQSPVIIASDVSGAESYSMFKPEQLVGTEDRSQPGDLFIVKSADKSAAQPGDIITFTLRYKNTGDRSLFNVQLIDNLTPRLEFVEGSATSDRDGRLVVEDNQEGSLILKFEVSEELKGGTGGVATFKTRVR